jgi:hypothetical protein
MFRKSVTTLHFVEGSPGLPALPESHLCLPFVARLCPEVSAGLRFPHGGPFWGLLASHVHLVVDFVNLGGHSGFRGCLATLQLHYLDQQISSFPSTMPPGQASHGAMALPSFQQEPRT